MEYVAVVALVAIVLGAATALTSGGLGGEVLYAIRSGLCAVGGGPCPQRPRARPDLPPCPLARSSRRDELGETILSIRLGASGALLQTRDSSGRVTVSFVDGGDLGAAGGIGLHFGVGRVKVGGELSASLVSRFAAGRSWTFADARAAQRFVDRYGDEETMAGKLVKQARGYCSVVCDALGVGMRHVPAPQETYFEGGLHGDAALELAAGPLQGRIAGALGSALGRRVGRGGEITFYFRLDASAGASLGGVFDALAARADGATTAAYTVDRAGHPLRLALSTAGRVTGSLQLAAGGEGLGQLERHLRSLRAGANASAGSGRAVEADATLDLTDPVNRRAAQALIAGLDARHPGSLLSAARTLGQLLRQRGQIDLRTLAIRRSAGGVDAGLAAGIKLAASYERSRGQDQLQDAWTRLPGLRFLPRADCL